ncbi:MAG: hypothetical protein M0D57_10575 [Sphingobacteriales bacterium JAD_PAG50586_3]|nr:MAG: hypothetical protein M0D57_10575 [Sphingobacteriales bacterium JAD_PAG50586_3]
MLAQIKSLREIPAWIDNDWYKDNVLKPIRLKLLYAKIVTTATSSLQAILTNDGGNYMWFPTGSSKEIRLGIWNLTKDWFPHCLPKENEVELWNKLIWKECGKLTLTQLAEFIEALETIDVLAEKLKTRDAFEWLNEFYSLLKDEENEFDSILNNKAIFPNQKGILSKRTHLLFDNGISDEFKDILKLLDEDIREKLIDNRIDIDFEEEDKKDESFAIKIINAEVNEKSTDREVAKKYSEAFKKLLLWFQKIHQKQIIYSRIYLKIDTCFIMMTKLWIILIKQSNWTICLLNLMLKI